MRTFNLYRMVVITEGLCWTWFQLKLKYESFFFLIGFSVHSGFSTVLFMHI